MSAEPRAGLGANRNLPLAPGTGDATWLAAVDVLCAEVRARGADALVVSLGAGRGGVRSGEPAPGQRRTAYREAGERIGTLAPTVVVQEGGYDLPTLGRLVVAAPLGLAFAAPRAPLDRAGGGYLGSPDDACLEP